MSVAVPAIPFQANLFSDEQGLYQLLSAFQANLGEKARSQIVSFSQPIELLDPLTVLQAIAQPDQLHFYWENPSKNEAIVGCGTAKSIQIDSPDRFSQCQEFIASSLKEIVRIGSQDIPGSGPHLFCSFTFFDSPKQTVNCPFPSATVFLPQVQIVRTGKHCTLTLNFPLDKKANIQCFLRQIQAINLSNKILIKFLKKEKQGHHKPHKYSSYSFKSAITSALNSIEANHFSKLVLAHTLDVILPTFNLVTSLNNLRKNYPNCYIFSVGNGRGNYFIGASPERLISVRNRQVVADALAGSAPRGETAAQDARLAKQLLGSGKERREHQAVIEFIIDRLYQLGLTPQCSPLKLLQLSNIQHLWTPIHAQLKSNIHPLEIVAKLHPTPAVAGVPTEIACRQIRSYETFDRALYAAPLGWIDARNNSEFIVGIRSALIEGNRARLYAGAGIVAGSDPAKELAEIQLKFQALLKALL